MKRRLFISLLVAAAGMFCNPAFAQLSPYDANKPIGWAALGNGTTGNQTDNSVVVHSEEELKAAVKTGMQDKTIYLSGSIFIHGHFYMGSLKNITIYGLPGSELYNDVHTDVQDDTGILYFKECENIIMRNVTFRSAGAYDISGADNVVLVTCKNVWIDHCDFQDGVDGNIDIKTATDNVSITWCRFRYLIKPWAGGKGGANDHRCNLLIGSGDKNAEDVGKLNTTIAYCWFDEGCHERSPRVRKGKIHIVNCLYTNTDQWGTPALYCIGPGYLANIYAEKNDFSAIPSQTMIWKNYATEKNYKDYNITMTDNLNASEVKSSVGGKEFYAPHVDGSDVDVKCYDKSLVQSMISNADNGAGATLDEDLLATRGNDSQIEPTAINLVGANHTSANARAYYNINGIQAPANAHVSTPFNDIIIEVDADGNARKIVR